MRTIMLSGLATGLLAGALVASGAGPSVAWSINLYDAGATPDSFGPAPNARRIMGERDPNFFVIDGPANGSFTVSASSIDIPHGDPTRAHAVFPPVSGTFDGSGHAEIRIPPWWVAEGDQFTLRAHVDGGSSGVPIGVDVVRTMSSFIALGMPVGSLANARGCLMGMTNDSIFIGNIEYAVTAKTELGNLDDLSELVVGQSWLVVTGRFMAGGGFEATEINLENLEQYTRLEGRVQGIGPSGLALMNVSVYVSPNTQYYDYATGEPRTFEDVGGGMPIEVFIDTHGTMYPEAVEIALNVPIEPEPEPEPEREPEQEFELPPPPYCG
ncbi:MAG: hypothetical protein KDA25_03170 [Phycisphaerales bacterium]|nr:hypothetical protein [Phycisphaerales bacterium]